MNFGVLKTVVRGQSFVFVKVFAQTERCPHTITQEIAPNCNVQRKLLDIVGSFPNIAQATHLQNSFRPSFFS